MHALMSIYIWTQATEIQFIINIKGSKREISFYNEVRFLRFLARILRRSTIFRGVYENAFKDCQSRCEIIKQQLELPPKNALPVYRAFVRPKIEFAHITSCNLPKYVGKGTQAFENRILKRGKGLTPSTPQHILNIISGKRSISKRTLSRTAKDLTKINKTNPCFFHTVVFFSDEVSYSYNSSIYLFIYLLNKLRYRTNH